MNIFAVLPTESKKGKKLGPRNKNKIKRPDTIVEEQQIQQALETQSVHSEDSYVPQGYFHPGHWMGFSLDPPFAPAQVKRIEFQSSLVIISSTQIPISGSSSSKTKDYSHSSGYSQTGHEGTRQHVCTFYV